MDVDLRSPGSRLEGAGTAIEIHPSTGVAGEPLGTIKKGKCRLKGTNPNKILLAGGKSTDGAFVLNVQVREW
ncbi:MAG: hypothetical protein ACRDL1_12755 [Solirubrobacterales bacterium]